MERKLKLRFRLIAANRRTDSDSRSRFSIRRFGVEATVCLPWDLVIAGSSPARASTVARWRNGNARG